MLKSIVCFTLACAANACVMAAPVVFSAVTTAGAADPAFNASIDAFRAAMGGVLNPPGACSPTPCVSGRREINWDAVPVAQSSPNNFNPAFFNGTAGVDPAGRQRGASFSTPGTGFRVSATEFSEETTFGPAEFEAFSPRQLFASMGSPVTDVVFSVPGSPSAAAFSSAFGVVFSDVDYTGAASLEFFGLDDASLGKFDVSGVFDTPNGQNSQGSFSFLGVHFNAGERVGRVRIVSGSLGIDGPFVNTTDDAVVMDDFIYAEPLQRSASVPEPGTALLVMLAGVLAARSARRCR